MARKIDPEKRKRILQAARKTFNEIGVEKTPISLIAKEADVATGTIYLYFKSKEDIVEGLVDLYMNRYSERFIPALSHPNIATAIKNAVHEALQHAGEEKDLLRLIDVRRSSGRSKPTKGEEMGLRAIETWLNRVVEQGIAIPYNSRIVAEIIGGMIEGIAKLCFVYKAANISRYEKTLVSVLQHGLLKDFGKKRP